MKLKDRVVANNTILETYDIEDNESNHLLIYYNRNNGEEIKRVYYKDDKMHKEGGPAYIMRYPNGNIKEERYIINDMYNRTDGPSKICWRFCDGEMYDCYWFNKGKDLTLDVEKWLERNNFNSWKEMNETDFNRMWFEIL